MTEHGVSRRRFLQNTAYTGAAAVVLGGCTSSGGGQGGAGAQDAAVLPVEGSQVILDPAQFPKTFAEWPEFAKKVKAGQLPPVAERIGQDPLVIKPLHETGRYGGVIRRGYLGTGDQLNAALFCGGPDSLLYWDYQGEKVIPNVARDFELSDDDRILTLHLRRGMKWSDGKPFTADDIIFWRENINLHSDLGGAGTSALRAGGKNVEVKKIDDYTVQFVSARPNSILPELLASNDDLGGQAAAGRTFGGGYAPKHYLSQFHPEFTSMAAVDKLAKDAGFDDWTAYFKDRMSWELNLELPAVSPWILSRPISSPPWEFVPNPYSIWVDVKGNQLPYIPKITLANTENPEVFNLRAVAGQFDFQDRNLLITNLPVLMKNRERGKYTIHRAPNSGLEFGIRFNLAHTKDKPIGELLRNVDFRRALSLGIDRDPFIQTFSLGTSKPSATMPADNSKYFPGPEWRRKWATLDLAQANSLLDKVGLSKKDDAGYRLRPDGDKRLTLDYQSVSGYADFVAMGEMLKRQWQKIGIDLNVQKDTPELITQRASANELVITGHIVQSENPFLRPNSLLPTTTDGFPGMMGLPYARWFASDGRDGTEPPASLDLLKHAMDLYEQGLAASPERRAGIGQELFKLHADQVWTIGVFGFGLMANSLYYANNKLTNVPGSIVNALVVKQPSNLLSQVFSYK